MKTMTDRIVVDVEIQKGPDELPNGWESTELMGVACAVVYDYTLDRFRVYGPEDLSALKTRIVKADEVIGFNTWKFDFPVIWKLPGHDRVMHLYRGSNDILRRIWQALGLDPDKFTKEHQGWSLDRVCKGTLNRCKIGQGAEAPQWFKDGIWARGVAYCIDDVALTRDLADFIDRYGYVVRDDGRVLKMEPFQCP